jgi:hypothetical protein
VQDDGITHSNIIAEPPPVLPRSGTLTLSCRSVGPQLLRADGRVIVARDFDRARDGYSTTAGLRRYRKRIRNNLDLESRKRWIVRDSEGDIYRTWLSLVGCCNLTVSAPVLGLPRELNQPTKLPSGPPYWDHPCSSKSKLEAGGEASGVVGPAPPVGATPPVGAAPPVATFPPEDGEPPTPTAPPLPCTPPACAVPPRLIPPPDDLISIVEFARPAVELPPELVTPPGPTVPAAEGDDAPPMDCVPMLTFDEPPPVLPSPALEESLTKVPPFPPIETIPATLAVVPPLALRLPASARVPPSISG